NPTRLTGGAGCRPAGTAACAWRWPRGRPKVMSSFAELPLLAALQESVAALGYAEPTPIQAKSLPAILAGKDVIAQAPTGSGKTAACGLGLLRRLRPGTNRTQALVLCPTRELAGQVGRELRRLGAASPNIKLTLLTG